MTEYQQHQLSRVVPDSERAYYAALTQAYKEASAKLLSSNISTQKRLIKVVKEIQAELYRINNDLITNLDPDIVDIITVDAAYTHQELNIPLQQAQAGAELYTLPKSTIKKMAHVGEMVFYRTNAKGTTLQSTATAKQMLESIAGKAAEDVRGVIMASYAQGDTTESMVRKIRPFMTTKQKRHARTVIRTVIGEASEQASKEFYKENSDYIEGYIFIATLDSKTSVYCGTHDGKRYKTMPDKLKNFHPNCRSTILAVSDGYSLSDRPIVLADGTIKRIKGDLTYLEAVKLFPELLVNKPISQQRYIKSLVDKLV